MDPTTDDRLALIDQVIDDPPAVHEGAPGGVWGTSRELYAFIADNVSGKAVTLETGLGISTVLFARWSSSHTCVVGSGDQVEALRSFADTRGIDLSGVRFEIGRSDLVLPRLETEPIDLYLIDGGHGFPCPTIDWYYGSLRLAAGGIVVVDDVQLPAVSDYLISFLDADARWEPVGGSSGKWLAYRKLGEFSVAEEWTNQPFLGGPRRSIVNRLKIAAHRQLTRLRR